MKGKIFGTPAEVRKLAETLKLCLDAIDTTNQKADSLLSELSDTAKDVTYKRAETMVNEVKELVKSCKEPSEETITQLEKYAEFLSHI